MGWKLVRDNHRKLFEGKISGSWRTSPDPVSALIAKLGEEYGEFAAERDPGELYDMLDAAHELVLQLDPGGRLHRRHAEGKSAVLGVFRRHLEWHPDPELMILEVGSDMKEDAVNETREKEARTGDTPAPEECQEEAP